MTTVATRNNTESDRFARAVLFACAVVAVRCRIGEFAVLRSLHYWELTPCNDRNGHSGPGRFGGTTRRCKQETHLGLLAKAGLPTLFKSARA
jgi:hypothetical protein